TRPHALSLHDALPISRTYCWSFSTSARLSNTRDGTKARVSPVSGSVYVGPGRIGCQYTPYLGSYRGGPSGSGGHTSTKRRFTHWCPIPPGFALARRRGRIPGTVLRHVASMSRYMRSVRCVSSSIAT